MPFGTNDGIFPGCQLTKCPPGLRAPGPGFMPAKPGPGSASSRAMESPRSSIRTNAWWTTRLLPGRNSTPRTKRARSSGIGSTKLRYTSRPSAGTGNGSGMLTTKSGSPSCQPVVNAGTAGVRDASPSGAPCSCQRPSNAICSAVSRRSPTNRPYPSTGSHGGMNRLDVTSAICFDRFLTSSYESSGNGPASPGRWQMAQFSKITGAMSSANVGCAESVEPAAPGAVLGTAGRSPQETIPASRTASSDIEPRITRITRISGRAERNEANHECGISLEMVSEDPVIAPSAVFIFESRRKAYSSSGCLPSFVSR